MFSALSLHSLISFLHHSSLVITNNISVLSSKLVSKVVDFWRLGVNILVDRFVGFLTSMVHCMGNAFGCIIWCPSAFTSLAGLKSFPLGSIGLFHMLIPPPGFTMLAVGQSCATHLLSCLEQASLDVVPDILSCSISYTCRCTHMQVEDLLEMIACLRVFKLPNFKAWGELALGFGGTPILMWHTRSWCCRATSLPRITFTSVKSLNMVLWKGSLSVWLHFLTCTWWDGCHVSWNMFSRSRSNARAYSRVLLSSTFSSSLPYPSHHALPYIQCLYSLHGHSHLHKESDIQILGSWQLQYAADQRTGP